MCQSKTSLKRDAKVPSSTWFSLLLHGYTAERNEVPRPPMDCVGTPIVLDAADDACTEPLPGAEPLPTGKLSEADVVTQKLSPSQSLVWAQTRRFHNGEALGPVALVEVQDKALYVRALGTLRALSVNPQLKLQKLGTLTVLVVESESCDEAALKSCQKIVRLVPLRQERFIPEPFVDAQGGCVGPAWLHTYRERKTKQGTNSVRSSELTATLSFRADEIIVDEHVSVRDTIPGQPAAPAVIHHNADGQRRIRFQNGKMIVTGPSLWTRLVEPTTK
jgi:hypothetical protein